MEIFDIILLIRNIFKNMKKTKKQLSPLQRKLLAGFLILIIVVCWTFIGVKITIGPEKAKAYTAVNVGGGYSCRGNKEGACGGFCSEGLSCQTREKNNGDVVCGCYPSGKINTKTQTNPSVKSPVKY